MTTGRGGHGADGWSAAVRERIGLGRLLPLGEAADGSWLAERAATTALRRTAAGVSGAVVGPLRVRLADPDSALPPAVPPPPSALPPGALRIEGDVAAVAGEPLPDVAERLRTALYAHAVDRLGLRVTEVDLRVTALLEKEPDADIDAEDSAWGAAPVGAPAVASQGAAAVVAASVAGVAGVAHLTQSLGAPVLVTRDHVRVELATAAGHHPSEVARAVGRAVAASLPGHPTVAVLITAVDVPG